MFRSETMQHGTLVIPADRARDLMELLGTKTLIEIIDMNSHSLKRQYRRYVQRIDEMERILRFLFDEIHQLSGTEIISADYEKFLSMETPYQLDQVEQSLKTLYEQFYRFKENNTDLTLQKNRAIEEKCVLQVALASFEAAYVKGSHTGGLTSEFTSMSTSIPSILQNYDTSAAAPETTENDLSIGFSNICGVINTTEQNRFARAIFRATRGNAYTFFELIDNDIVENKSNQAASRSVFVIYFQSSTGGSALKAKISKLCSAYNVTVYTWPKSVQEATAQLNSLNEVILEKSKALNGYEKFFLSEISTLLEVHSPAGGSLIEEYRLFCIKEKAIYATLNLFEGEEHTLRANCWLPKSEVEPTRSLLSKIVKPHQASAFLLTDKSAPKQSPPTYNRTTEFTQAFQSFVDTYGVPRYKEINPAVVTIVTFPFLFGIMYGDIGHAICLLIFALYIIINIKPLSKSTDETVQLVLYGRYMVLLMAIFALFAGFLYNDFFSLGLDLFGSRYTKDYDAANLVHLKLKESLDPYPLGFDPAWKGASNEFVFTNSFKMKFSIIVGFVQMTLGVLFLGMNTIYFKDIVSFTCDFLPRIVFLFSVVGYMVFMIVHKWVIAPRYINNVLNKPLIIASIIEMCMRKAPTIFAFEGQVTFQNTVWILMVASIPLMAIPKLVVVAWLGKRKKKNALKHQEDLEWEATDSHEEGDSFAELLIHQTIETIEFVLGAISNTASYLRLWALSLAHQQLAALFFNLIIKSILGFEGGAFVNGIVLFVAFAFFACVTFAVLLCMDSLECFLHALRLQWVEFQNKFYAADGYPFQPFSFHNKLIGI